MKLFNKIAIVGVGLIGGSIGMAAKKRRLANEIIGLSRRKSSRRKAVKFGAVDKATLNLKEAVSEADLVIIAVPVGKILESVRLCVKFMKNGAVLSDVGSVKGLIVREAEKLAGDKVKFVGSHPMAGSEKTGVENASSGMFRNASVIITKTKNTNPQAFKRLARFWKLLGSRVYVITPGKHDRVVSLASYLPHAISSALSLSQSSKSLMFAAGSLKDATRVSSSDPELWKDIFLSADKAILESIGAFSKKLKALEHAIRRRDSKTITQLLIQAKKIRDGMGWLT